MADNIPLRMNVPDDLQGGVYANVVGVWHGPFDFTLDFGVAGMTQRDEDGTSYVPAPVVARVKVPPQVIFRIAQAIAENVDRYERNFGPINQPRGTGSGTTTQDGPPT